jgi:carbonic anhydrase
VEKLIKGIVEFRSKLRPEYAETFARLALGQSPDTLFIACSDSRVVPNLFASTDPGDLFVIRNVGNLISPCGPNGVSLGDVSEAAAIEYSVLQLGISHIVICGHSECAAMKELMNDKPRDEMPMFKTWLHNAFPALTRMEQEKGINRALAPHNKLSQANVLQQIEHLKSYPSVKKMVAEGKLSIHGWWFDIAHAEVYAYEENLGFTLIDETEGERILVRMGKRK